MDGNFLVYTTPKKGSLFVCTATLDLYTPPSNSPVRSTASRISHIEPVPPHLIVLPALSFIKEASALVISAVPSVQYLLKQLLQRLGTKLT